MSFDEKSRAYDPNYKPTKTLEQLVAENPHDKFLSDRLAERQAADKSVGQPSAPLKDSEV